MCNVECNDDACWWTLTRDDFQCLENCSLIQQFTMRIALRCTLSQSECCQDDSVNCSCFRKDKMKLKACSIHVRERVRMSIVQLSCICLWTTWRRKKKQHGRQRQGRDGVSVQMSMSMHCTVCDMLKLKELTQSVLSGYRCVQHDMLRIKQGSDKLSWGLDTTDTCIVHKQTIHDFATTKTDLSEKRKTTKTPRRVSKREGTTSSTWIDRQTWLHFSICACHPNSSQDCHMTQ